MDIKQIGSVLLCWTCVFLMPGHALELNADVVYEQFSRRMDDVIIENLLLRTKLEEAVRKMENQADRIANLEKASIKIEKQAEKIASLEKVVNKLENQAGEIANFEEVTNKKQNQADRMASLEETVNKMKKEADRITNLEETVNKIENRANDGTSIVSGMQKLNNRIAKLENSTLNIEKAISNVTRLVTENNMKVIKESESSINTIQDVTMKQSVTVRKMLSAVKLSVHNKFISFRNEVKLQMLAMNISVESQMSAMSMSLESQMSSLETFLKRTENTVSVTLNDYSNEVNGTFVSLRKEIKTFVNENERKLETLREKTDKEWNHNIKTLYEAYGEIKWQNEHKFGNFTADVILQMSTMKNSVESQMSSFETSLKRTENTISVSLNHYSNEVNGTFLSLQKEIKTFVNENERELETLRQKMDKESDNLNVVFGEIQQLQTKTVEVEKRQGKRAAFLVRAASQQSNGILHFASVYLNEGSVYNRETGEFMCPFPGLYVFIANVIEGGNGDNYINCFILKNGSIYVSMYSRQGKIDGMRATDGMGTATGGATLHLMKGDRVYVFCYSDTAALLGASSFSGFLVSADP